MSIHLTPTKLISTIIASTFLFANTINTFAITSSLSNSSTTQSSNSSSSTLSSTALSSLSSVQSSLASALPNGKKQLKKALSLDYTNPKFETDLSTPQKNAILKSLKKWKSDLPVDNKFTVTSLANLKSDTNENKQSKKSNKNTANSMVVYMWASTPNPLWDNNRPYNVEDYESGDPRFIRTEFNILLKQAGNSSWKATLERDAETKVEIDL